MIVIFQVRKLRTRRIARFLIGALFVLVVLFEVGSHSFLDAHHHDDEVSAVAVELHQSESDDDCDTYFGCLAEDDDHESQQPNAQDQSTHHDMLAASNVIKFVRNSEFVERFISSDSSSRFWPPSLPFHPPKTA